MFVGHGNLACSWLTVVVGLTQNVAVNKTAFMRMCFCVLLRIFLGQHMPKVWVNFHELNIKQNVSSKQLQEIFLR